MTKTKRLIYTLSLLALAVTVQPATAFAGWVAKFSAPTSPMGSLHVGLPENLDMAELTSLGVEIDGIDVTALLSLEVDGFSYAPAAPFGAGLHKVRLVAINADGTVSERASWSFSMSGATGAQLADGMASDEAWLRSASVNINTDTELSARIADANLGNTVKREIVSGGGDISTHFEGEKWTASTTANYMAMSEQSLSQTGNTLDIGEYNIKLGYTGDNMKSGLELGHQDLGLDSFLFSSFNRRGASLSAGSNDDRIEAKAFALRPESQVGGRNFTGVDDGNHRLDGGMISFKPFGQDDDALKVTGIYYTGEGTTNGSAVVDANANAQGRGWGGIVEKEFSGGRASLRGEYARATYDADGTGTLVGENDSNAVSLSGSVRPFEHLIVWDRDVDLTVGARYDRVDTFFQSLGNAGLPADRDAITAFTNVIMGAFSGNLQVAQETNNVDDLASAPTDRMRSIALNTAYSFDQQEGARAWLGTPYVTFGLTLADIDRDKTPLGYAGPQTDNKSRAGSLGFGSSYETWSWSASHMVTFFEDDANTANDTVNNLTSLALNWTPSDRATVNGGVQFGAFDDDTALTSNYNTNLTLGGSFALIPEKLDFNVDYNLNLATGSNDTPDKNVLNSEIEWTFLQSGTNHPGLAFALRGSMEDNHEDTAFISNDTNYQIFSVLRLKAPYAYNR